MEGVPPTAGAPSLSLRRPARPLLPAPGLPCSSLSSYSGVKPLCGAGLIQSPVTTLALDMDNLAGLGGSR